MAKIITAAIRFIHQLTCWHMYREIVRGNGENGTMYSVDKCEFCGKERMTIW